MDSKITRIIIVILLFALVGSCLFLVIFIPNLQESRARKDKYAEYVNKTHELGSRTCEQKLEFLALEAEFGDGSVIVHNLPDKRKSFPPPDYLDDDLGKIWSDIKSHGCFREEEVRRYFRAIQFIRNKKRGGAESGRE